jgi:Fe-S-cluster containining protein
LAVVRSPCRRCGACCRAISLDFSLEDLARLAADEQARLARHPGSPHRREIERLIADVAFLRAHFRPIDRAQAVARNPHLAHADFADRHFFLCDLLDADGSCREHAARPFVCEGYPFYLGQPDRRALVHSPCGYESALDAGQRRAP